LKEIGKNFGLIAFLEAQEENKKKAELAERERA